MPEWMDETVDTDGHAGMATFEQDGTYIRSPTIQPIAEENKKQTDLKSAADEPIVQSNTVRKKTKFYSMILKDPSIYCCRQHQRIKNT